MTPEIQRLLETTIDSFEKLEIVRSLWRTDGAAWSIDRLAERVGTSSDHMGPSLEELAAEGLLCPTRDHAYTAVKSHVRATSITQLLELYERDPLVVMRVINAIAVRRIRAMAARTFADSFLMRRPRRADDDG